MARQVAGKRELIPVLGEVFRAHGYEGASLSIISDATGLGKGSLYHFFPGGKEEMATAVLAEIGGWFEAEVYAPLRACGEPRQGIQDMLESTVGYFKSGRRVCLVGVLALGAERDRFAAAIQRYFEDWIEALAGALVRSGQSAAAARPMAQEAVATIQGSLMLARALQDERAFTDCIARLRCRLLASG